MINTESKRNKKKHKKRRGKKIEWENMLDSNVCTMHVCTSVSGSEGTAERVREKKTNSIITVL